MAIWDQYLTETDRAVIAGSGHQAKRGLGERPVLVVIDIQYGFVGVDKPILESIKEYSSSVGERAWRAMEKAKELIDAAHAYNIPVFYTQSGVAPGEEQFDSFARKRSEVPQPAQREHDPYDIVDLIAPSPGDVVIKKRFASGFAGTHMVSYLNVLKADTLILCGFTTGGCVRATAVDGAAYNYNIAVAGDATADRIEVSHAVALLDIDMKYGDVMQTDEIIAYMKSLTKATA